MRAPLIFLVVAIAATSSFAISFGEPDIPDTVAKLAPNPSVPVRALRSGTEKLTPTELAFAKELYVHGQSKQLVGRIMSWGGLGMAVIGGLGRQPVLQFVGDVSLLAGIPVNGSGTSDMLEAANQLNPEIVLDERGWSTYGLSWGLMGGGMTLALLGGQDGTVSGPIVLTGGVLLLAGGAFQFVAWYQFSDGADRAELSRKNSPYSFVLRPEAVVCRGNGLAPGLALEMKF